jgi:hypothetical protein
MKKVVKIKRKLDAAHKRVMPKFFPYRVFKVGVATLKPFDESLWPT